METDKLMKTAYHAAMLIVLVIVLLGIVTWTGVLKPSQIPIIGKSWCGAYWGVVGYASGGPRIAIVTGNDGLGNPDGPCEEGVHGRVADLQDVEGPDEESRQDHRHEDNGGPPQVRSRGVGHTWTPD